MEKIPLTAYQLIVLLLIPTLISETIRGIYTLISEFQKSRRDLSATYYSKKLEAGERYIGYLELIYDAFQLQLQAFEQMDKGPNSNAIVGFLFDLSGEKIDAYKRIELEGHIASFGYFPFLLEGNKKVREISARLFSRISNAEDGSDFYTEEVRRQVKEDNIILNQILESEIKAISNEMLPPHLRDKKINNKIT